MRHVVYGTAGHIDHGKTSLVKALTGTDCDRLPEEQERGITIELGFAQLAIDDLQIHFVDVPGHERLVHTMIAGAAGIDLALLVVAADESVMPQTREHLDVIRLMGVAGGAVALTKIDLVDRELAELAAEEVREILADTSFADVPVVPVSAHTGAGLDQLRATLVAQAAAARPRQVAGRPFRQAVDRVFSMTGAGTVITGTSLWGTLRVGEEALVMPAGRKARVRRLHVHGRECDSVEAGERVAINLVGIPKDKIQRGDQVMSLGPWRASRLVTLRLEMLGSGSHTVDEGDEVELHALAARIPARIDRLARRPLAPGQSAVAQLSLSERVPLFPGDRVVLRRPAPVNTFAGGVVLDSELKRVRRRDAARLDEHPSVGRENWSELLESWVAERGLLALSVDDMATRLGVYGDAIESTLGRLLNDRRIVALPMQPPHFVSRETMNHAAELAARELRTRLQDTEVSAGIPARDFAGAFLPRPALDLTNAYLEALRTRRILDLVEGRVVPHGGTDHMTESGAALTRRVDEAYRGAGLEPPSPTELAMHLEEKPAAVEGICRYLLQKGQLVRLDGKFLIHSSALHKVAEGVRSWAVESFAVGEFKDRFGLTRKLAIPILEWLDAERVTIRQGDRRKVLPQRS